MNEIKIEKYSSYRDSGVEWSGLVPENWGALPIRAIFEERNEKNEGRKTEYILSVTKDRGVIPYDEKGAIGNNKSEDIERYKLVYPNDFVINKMNVVIGSLGMSKYFGAFSQVYLVYKPRTSQININYYSYIFSNPSFYKSLIKYCTGIMELRESLNKDDFKKLILPFPDYQTQTAVVEYLDRKTALIDQAVDIKQKQIELLKERRQILIHKAVTKGLNAGAKLKDSGVEWIGQIPEGWELKRLKEFCKAFGRIGFRGYTTSDLVSEGEGAITISPSNIKGEFMTFEKCSYLSWNKYRQSPEIQIFEDDILMVKTGSTFGKTGIVKNPPQEATVNPQLIVLKEIKINSDYFYNLLKTSMVQYQVQTEVIGSTIPTISETKILNFKVAMPQKSEMEEILKYIENATAKIATAISLKEQEIEKLKEYKATLINSAVTGKIKISNYAK